MEPHDSAAKRERSARGGTRALFPARALGRVALALLALAPACRTVRPEKPPYAHEIEERNRHLEQQFRDGNLLGVADLYADDAEIVDAQGNRVRGRDDIDAYWTGIEAPLEWRLEIRHIVGSDTLAYELGRSHLTTLRDGERRTAVADFLVLWRREADGAWKIAYDAYWPVQP